MPITGMVGRVRYIETWVTENIATSAADGVTWLVSSDGGDTAFARTGSAARGLHAAAALAATDNNMVEICGNLAAHYVQSGRLHLEAVFALDVLTDIAFNVGWNDTMLEAGGNTLPIELSGTTWTSTSSAFGGLVFDVDADNDDVHAFWVDDDADTSTAIASLRLNGASLSTTDYIKCSVTLTDRGSGNGARMTVGYADGRGRSMGRSFNTTLDRDVALGPYIAFENRAATAHAIVIPPGGIVVDYGN